MWLDDDENTMKWYGEDSPINASEKQILVTHQVSNTYRQLASSKYDSFRWQMLEKTGCLVTADGSEDKKIQPEGLSNYTVPPPIALDFETTLASATAPPETLEKRGDMIYDDFEGDEEGRDVQLTIGKEVDEDRWIFDLHC